jgi:hypothetical protein
MASLTPSATAFGQPRPVPRVKVGARMIGSLEVAILIVSTVAAVGAVGAIALDAWRRYPRLKITPDLYFFNSTPREVRVKFRIENIGDAPIHQVDLYILLTGSEALSVGTVQIRSGEWLDQVVPLSRAQQADIGANEVLPTLKLGVGVMARTGRHQWIGWHPWGTVTGHRGRFGPLKRGLPPA